MSLGLGIVLLVVGLIFGLDAVRIPPLDRYVDLNTLGWILVVVGILAIVLSLVTQYQSRTTTSAPRDDRYR